MCYWQAIICISCVSISLETEEYVLHWVLSGDNILEGWLMFIVEFTDLWDQCLVYPLKWAYSNTLVSADRKRMGIGPLMFSFIACDLNHFMEPSDEESENAFVFSHSHA